MYDPNDFDWTDWKAQYERVGPVLIWCLRLLALLLAYGIAIEGMINGVFS